jgi:hypothetical protein
VVAKRKYWSGRDLALALAGCVYLFVLAVYIRRDTAPLVVAVRTPLGVEYYVASRCVVYDRCVSFTDQAGRRMTVCGDSVVVSGR